MKGKSDKTPWPKKKKRLTLIDHPNMTLLLRDLDNGPANIHDLAVVLSVDKRQVYDYLRVARAAHLVRIIAWERSPGGRPVYARKTSPMQRNAPRPGRQSFAESKRRYRAKKAIKCDYDQNAATSCAPAAN